MNPEELDGRIRDEINNLQRPQENIKWNVKTGWERYKRKYVYKKKRRNIWYTSAAAALFVALILTLIKPFRPKDKDLLTFVTDSIQKKEILLKDGSKIWLNTSSYTKINLKKNEIELEGEAYLELSGEHEYSISSPHSEYNASACAFNLKSRKKEDGAILTVSAGEVAIFWVSDITGIFVVEAGNQAKIVPRVAIVKIPIFDVNYLAWKTKELHFDNTPLYYVFEKLEELNDIRIDVTDKSIRYCRISTDFKTLSAAEVLRKISEYFDYRLDYKENTFLIEGKGCNI